ncbi:MAG: hypothetical protein ACOX2Q_01670 [Dehalobacterium sp.]
MKEHVKLTLCQKGCCPSVEFNDDTDLIIIKDDLGGQVSLTEDQFKILLEEYLRHAGDL